MQIEKPSISIVMPVSSDPLFFKKKSILQNVAEKCNITIMIPEFNNKYPEFISKFEIDRLSNYSAILADLTFERPSCYFELGFAEALGKPIKLIAEKGTSIHQTSYRSDVKYYSNLDEFEEIIENILKSI